MGIHYICRGECEELSGIEGVCTEKECIRMGKQLEACTCIDGQHNSLREDEEEEDDD